MDMQGFFTKKGLLLAAKLAAGSTLTITRVCAGAAETALTASALSQIRQTLSVGAARRAGDTAVLPVTLEAGMAGSAYNLRELGVYARDPDEGEILYKVYRLSEPVAVRPSSRLVLRFYLEETVSQDLNVTVVRASAGLLTEADLEPVYRKLLAAGAVPVRTVELAGAELHAYIASLPRLLTETVEVRVSGSVTSGAVLYLNGFHGGGMLKLIMTDPDAVCSSHINAAHNHSLISITGFHFVDPAPGGQSARTGVYAAYGSQVVLDCCSFSGGGGENNAYTAVDTYEFGSVLLSDVSASGCGHVATAGPGCVVVISKGSEPVSMQNNITGAMVWKGGTVILCPGVPETLGGASNVKSGGMIVKGDGTLI